MKRTKKWWIVILSVLAAVLMVFDFFLYRAFWINPYRCTIHTKTLASSKIPKEMDGVRLVYVSDLEYGPNSRDSSVESIFRAIEHLEPDVFVFGGDVFDWNQEPLPDACEKVTQWFSAIEAPLGKFAVWGEQDVYQEDHKATVSKVFCNSDIEILRNSSLPIYLPSSTPGFVLIGLNPQEDISQAFSGLSSDSFHLLISHYPDNLTESGLKNQTVDFALAGNGHGTQITRPFLGGYKKQPGSLQLNRARKKKLDFPYYLTSGLGCLDLKARLNAPVEIVCLIFEAQEEKQP